MLSNIEFIEKCLKLVELNNQVKEIEEELKEYALVMGEQTVGPVSVKISTPSRKIDWEQTWCDVEVDTEVKIEDYIKETEPVPAVQYIDYRAACKAAKIKDDQLVVTNLEAIENNKTAKVTINHG